LFLSANYFPFTLWVAEHVIWESGPHYFQGCLSSGGGTFFKVGSTSACQKSYGKYL